VVIGDDCLISPNVTIIANNYNYQRLDVPIRQQGSTSKGVRIGANVWIGSGACILDGAQIGSGVIVAANSVVAGKIPDNAIVQGNPAKIIFTRR
jgi:acetyltransferase-like isoleucine patch superfamily enzyme